MKAGNIIRLVIFAVIRCESFSPSQTRHQIRLPVGRNLGLRLTNHEYTKIETKLNDGSGDVRITDNGESRIEKGPLLPSDTDTSEQGQVNGNRPEMVEQIEVPSIMKILNFALPAIGIYLCSPLLSMIDTSTVGLLSGTLQQAALNPAITITDYSSRAMSFLYTGTTNSIALSKGTKTPEQVKAMFLGSLRLAAIVGVVLAVFLLLTSQRLLVPLVGNDGIDVEVLHAAWRYVAIRAFGMPAAAMLGTSQAACLGLKDNKTPIRIILAASVLNLVLDLFLVGQKGSAWVGGAAGAAIATTMSQYFALYLFFRRFASTNTKTSEDTEETSSTKGLLVGQLHWREFFRLPCKDTLNEYTPFVIPVTTTQIGRCSTYVAMSHVVSSIMNEQKMAAQQIITSVFYTLIPIGDSCSLTAQTFLPSILSQKPSERRTDALRGSMKNIYSVAGILGVFLGLIAACIPLMCPLLTQDIAVTTTVNQIVPHMLGIMFTHGIFCASEGMLLGFRDLKFLRNIYAFFFVVVPMLMLRLKWVARAGIEVSLTSIWNIFLGYQAFRITSFASRAFFLRRRNSKTSDYASD